MIVYGKRYIRDSVTVTAPSTAVILFYPVIEFIQ
jgi:hypothetical protein